MASAVWDCRPSTGKAAAIELSVIARIPGKGGFDSGRYGTLRTPRTPENALQPRPADTPKGSFWRTGAVGKSPRQGRARGADHATLGDETGDQPRRRHVESEIRHRRAVWHDAHGLDAAVGGTPGHGRHLVGIAFLDGNFGHAVGNREIDGRRRQRHIKGYIVITRR